MSADNMICIQKRLDGKWWVWMNRDLSTSSSRSFPTEILAGVYAEGWLRGLPVTGYETATIKTLKSEGLETLEVLEFVECPQCAEKSGSPTLCESCLANRRTIITLKSQMCDLTDLLARLVMRAQFA